jgi:LysM repeat protein
MKKFFCTLFLTTALLFTQHLNAQQSYTSHKIKAGESLSGLAKKYHTTVGDIMRLNKMNQHSQLQIGETIKIPATKPAVSAAVKANTANNTQTTAPKPPVTVNPKADPHAVTHVVKKGETLYQISKQYDVPVLSIMNQNDLATADLKAGQVLIIKETLPVNPTSNEAVKEENELRVEKATQVTASSDQPSTTPTKKQDAVATNTTTLTVNSNISSETSSQQSVPSNISSTGYFASQFGVDVEGRDMETKTGSSMVFKTASGWTDKKYYILMDDVPPGSIVKISSDNNKVIYAKVLWSLGKMKENDGLTFRISNAAAAALDINDPKFNLTVTYYE